MLFFSSNNKDRVPSLSREPLHSKQTSSLGDKLKKSLAMFVSALLVTSLFPAQPQRANVVEDSVSNSGIVLSLGTYENGRFTEGGATEYPTDAPIPFAISMNVADSISSIPNAKLVITIPKAHIMKPQFAASAVAKESVFTEDADNYYQTYTFDQLTGGTIATFPTQGLSFYSGKTYKGDSFTVTAKLTDEKNMVLTEVTQTYTAKVRDLESRVPYLSSSDYSVKQDSTKTTPYYIVPAYATGNDATHGSTAASLYVGNVGSYFTADDIFKAGEGKFAISSLRIIGHLSEGAKFAQSNLNRIRGASISPDGQTLNVRLSGNYLYLGNGFDDNPYIDESNLEFGKEVKLTWEYIVDEGLPTQRTLTPRELTFLIQKTDYKQTSYFNTAVTKGAGYYSTNEAIKSSGSFYYFYNGKYFLKKCICYLIIY